MSERGFSIEENNSLIKTRQAIDELQKLREDTKKFIDDEKNKLEEIRNSLKVSYREVWIDQENGNDANNGYYVSPYKSIEGAVNANQGLTRIYLILKTDYKVNKVETVSSKTNLQVCLALDNNTLSFPPLIDDEIPSKYMDTREQHICMKSLQIDGVSFSVANGVIRFLRKTELVKNPNGDPYFVRRNSCAFRTTGDYLYHQKIHFLQVRFELIDVTNSLTKFDQVEDVNHKVGYIIGGRLGLNYFDGSQEEVKVVANQCSVLYHDDEDKHDPVNNSKFTSLCSPHLKTKTANPWVLIKTGL